MGSNPGAVYWMDMTFFHIDLLQELHCLFEKTKNKVKRVRAWPIKKRDNLCCIAMGWGSKEKKSIREII